MTIDFLILYIFCKYTTTLCIHKKKKKRASKTVKVEQTKTTVAKLLQLFSFTLFIYRNIRCTYNVNLYCKHIKIGKYCTHLQNLYNFFFFFWQMYIIFATFYVYAM